MTKVIYLNYVIINTFLCAFLASKDAAQSLTFGQVFIFGFISNFRGDGPLLAIVSNTNDYETNVTVTSIYDTFETINIIVQPNSIEKILINPVEIQARFRDLNGLPRPVVEDKGLMIQSTLPVAVYAHNESPGSADTFTLLPIDQLGMSYVAVGTIERIDLPNVIMAVAYHDATEILIGTHRLTIDALEVVTLAVKNNISGITVSGNKPFAAFSGNMQGWVTQNGFPNYAVTTLLPTAIWGRQFPLVPFMNITNQQYQIVANTNETIITINGLQFELNAGEFMHINITASSMLTSNYPVQLVQMGQCAYRCSSGHPLGAPYFLQIPSVDKWSNFSVQFQPTGYLTFESVPLVFIVRIYTTLSGIGQIAMDQIQISALLYHRIAQSNYYWYESQTTNDTHRISALNTNASYTVVSYTYGYSMGCGFPVALAI